MSDTCQMDDCGRDAVRLVGAWQDDDMYPEDDATFEWKLCGPCAMAMRTGSGKDIVIQRRLDRQ